MPGSPAPLCIAMLVYPGFTLLDLVGPHTVFTALPGAEVVLVGETRAPVMTDSGIAITPGSSIADAHGPWTVLCVPGGSDGTIDLLDNGALLDWVARAGRNAAWVTSVCSGALVLGAAGLLDGYRATSHWAVRDALRLFGAIPEDARVVIDRNRMTGGGVTAGIDFGLTLAAQLAGDDAARAIQLAMEYAPAPPFAAGTPAQAGPVITAQVLANYDRPDLAMRLHAVAQRRLILEPSENPDAFAL